MTDFYRHYPLIKLTKKLKYPDADLRRKAAYALGKIASTAAVTALIQAIKDLDKSVSSSAGEALVKIGYPVAIIGLIKAVAKGAATLRANSDNHDNVALFVTLEAFSHQKKIAVFKAVRTRARISSRSLTGFSLPEAKKMIHTVGEVYPLPAIAE